MMAHVTNFVPKSTKLLCSNLHGMMPCPSCRLSNPLNPTPPIKIPSKTCVFFEFPILKMGGNVLTSTHGWAVSSVWVRDSSPPPLPALRAHLVTKGQ